MKEATTKNLEGEEFKLDSTIVDEEAEKHKPEQIVFPFRSFGVGTKLQMRKNDKAFIYSGMVIDDEIGNATVISVDEDEDGQVTIYAIEETEKDTKLKYLKEITKEIDFEQGMGNETMIKMLSNVFNERQLKEFLEADDIEILNFEGLMYLRHKDKAYRL